MDEVKTGSDAKANDKPKKKKAPKRKDSGPGAPAMGGEVLRNAKEAAAIEDHWRDRNSAKPAKDGREAEIRR